MGIFNDQGSGTFNDGSSVQPDGSFSATADIDTGSILFNVSGGVASYVLPAGDTIKLRYISNTIKLE
jgi:hypothetical protein